PRFDHQVVGRHDLLQRVEAHALEAVAKVMRKIDEHPAALHAVKRHVLEPEMMREARVPNTVAARVRTRTHEVDARAIAVVVDGLFHTITVSVELRTHVRE